MENCYAADLRIDTPNVRICIWRKDEAVNGGGLMLAEPVLVAVVVVVAVVDGEEEENL